jgi:hypothetical protein
MWQDDIKVGFVVDRIILICVNYVTAWCFSGLFSLEDDVIMGYVGDRIMIQWV